MRVATLTALFAIVLFYRVDIVFSSPKGTNKTAKTSIEKKSKLQLAVATGYIQGLDQFDQPLSKIRFIADYKLNSKWYLFFTTEYISPLDGIYEDERNIYGIKDLHLGGNYKYPKFSKFLQLDTEMGIVIPTSNVSRVASLQIAAWGSVRLAVQLNKPLQLFMVNDVQLNQYEFDTAGRKGHRFNNPSIFTHRVGGAFSYDKIRLELSYAYSWLNSFGGKTIEVNRLGVDINYIISKQFSIYSGYTSKDRILTDNALFDDDNSQIFAGVKLSF